MNINLRSLRLHTATTLGAGALALMAAGTGTASAATTGEVGQTFCHVGEIEKVWYGGEQDAYTYEPCGDLREQFEHLYLYPGTSYTTASYPQYRVAVVEIQLMLRDKNYSPMVVDGHYGEQTAGAVKRYQRNHGLTVDGNVGQQTWTSLFSNAAPELH